MTVTLHSVEGRMLAQRQLLARLVHALDSDNLRDYLRQKSMIEVPEEDPGSAGPSDGYAIEASLADEMRLILETVERLDRG